MKKFFKNLFIRVEASVDKLWFIPLFGFLSGSDLFIAFVPIDAILISSTFLRPRKWVAFFVAAAVGSAIGAVLLGYVAQVYSESAVDFFVHGGHHSKSWLHTVQYLNDHGAWALALISFGPIPQQPAVILCGIAKMPLYKIFFSILGARLLKYGGFGWCALHAPRLLKKLKIVPDGSLGKGTLATGTPAVSQQTESKTNPVVTPQKPE